MSKQRMDTLFWGFLILLIGILFLAENLGLGHFDVWEIVIKFWPLILIYIGLKNILVHLQRKK